MQRGPVGGVAVGRPPQPPPSQLEPLDGASGAAARRSPRAFCPGFKTLQGGMLTTGGSGESYTAGKEKTNVVCGDFQTAKATVYIIVSVLMPPK